MAFKSEGKDMHPITVFAECWSIHSKMAWQACAQQRANREKPLPHKFCCSFTSRLYTCPASSATI